MLSNLPELSQFPQQKHTVLGKYTIFKELKGSLTLGVLDTRKPIYSSDPQLSVSAQRPDVTLQLVSHSQGNLAAYQLALMLSSRALSTVQQPAGLSSCLILKSQGTWSCTQKRTSHSQVVIFQNTLYSHSFQCHLHSMTLEFIISPVPTIPLIHVSLEFNLDDT